MQDISIGTTETSRSIRLKTGEELSIRLPENPTTGFRWAVEDAHDGTIEFTGAELLGSGTAPGAGGTRALRFKALKKGHANVKLVLRRDWQRDAPERAVTLMVEVD
jgi:inhibitor of cysteine peptidase